MREKVIGELEIKMIWGAQALGLFGAVITEGKQSHAANKNTFLQK